MRHFICRTLILVSAALAAPLTLAGVLPGPVVSTQWLADNLDKVQVVEVRANAKSYAIKPEVSTNAKGQKAVEEAGGHIPGAVLMDTKNMRTTRKLGGLEVKYMIPEGPDFEKLVRGFGVVAGKPLVFVPVGLDPSDMNDALRMLWQFKVYGQEEAAVLDGGYATWLLEGRPHTTHMEPVPAGTWKVVKDRTTDFFADSDDVVKAAGQGVSLVDGRDAQLFHGLVKRDYVFDFGHIPGAKLYGSDLVFRTVQGTQRFMPAATYKALLKAQQIDPDAPSIAYCNSGHLASAPWFVMSQILGNSKARLYDGSLHQWTLEKRPLAGAVPLK
jgi:thiosulfate/3-mercaptopyruvate sulfurtransferase